MVDDNVTSREILKEMLESFSFDVALAASGQEGISEIESADSAEPFELARCRTTLTAGERKRLLETWYYNRHGLPRIGRNRFQLIGELQEKPRPAMGALNGTLALDTGG